MNYKKIKTWEAAALAANIDPVESLPFKNPENRDQEASNAFFKIQIIRHVLNDGWVPDWDNWDEPKYYPWFRISGSGGFSYDDSDCALTHTCVGARLVYKTSELARYAGNQFEDIYKAFMTL